MARMDASKFILIRRQPQRITARTSRYGFDDDMPHLLDPANGTNVGVSFVPSIINPANGSRSESNFGYIAPYSSTSLVILAGYQVTKTNWNSTTSGSAVAGGVSFAASAGGTVYNVNAAKEVILSAGTIGSPQLLQLSGVGPKSLLTGLGIDSVVDLPGVGQNLQEHRDDTWAALKSDQTLWNDQLAIWRQSGTGMLSHIASDDHQRVQLGFFPGYNLGAFTSVTAPSMDPTVEAGVKAQYAILADWAASSSIGQVELIFNMFGSAASMIGIQMCIQHPFSRGYINIKTNSVFDYPEINPNYLSISYDLDVLRAAFKYSRNIIATAPMSDMIVGETTPGTGISTDDAINSYIASTSGTEYHPIGTNSMLPLEYSGVANTSLLVYGTTNLRVVDVSIAPMHVAAHTMATAYGIAERAADIIKATYGGVTTSSNGSSSTSSADSPGSTSNNDSTKHSSSILSTGAKIAIAAGSAVASIAVLAVRINPILPPQERDGAMSRAVAGGKEDPWYTDDLPMQPRAPFMAAGANRHSTQPSEFCLDSVATATHPDNAKHIKYDQQYYGGPHQQPAYYGGEADNRSVATGSEATYYDYDPQHRGYSPHSQYGAVHSTLSTPDVAVLHPSYPPGSPMSHSPMSPGPSPSQRYTDLPQHYSPGSQP
ncbi:hypothetical protein C8F01DRAFT_1234855 [Mycena amicta]|nr:hypothetical protein C8F01DRAFT_1234855 [Mycena amicta]